MNNFTQLYTIIDHNFYSKYKDNNYQKNQSILKILYTLVTRLFDIEKAFVC